MTRNSSLLLKSSSRHIFSSAIGIPSIVLTLIFSPTMSHSHSITYFALSQESEESMRRVFSAPSQRMVSVKLFEGDLDLMQSSQRPFSAALRPLHSEHHFTSMTLAWDASTSTIEANASSFDALRIVP